MGKLSTKFKKQLWRTSKLNLAFFFLLILILLAGIGYSVFEDNFKKINNNTYLSFVDEAYDKIKDNYWEKTPDKDLLHLYGLAIKKINEEDQEFNLESREDLEIAIVEALKELTEEDKKNFVVQLTDVVLANLQPFGRSRLYTQAQEKKLRDTVANIDHTTNLYEILGVDQSASQEEVERNYREKSEELKKERSEESQEKLEKIERAFETLAEEEARSNYNTTGAEITVFGKEISSEINYIKIKQMSPISFNEFQRVAKDLDKRQSNSLILDLRGNMGGAIDILPYFLGPFIGPNSYAYEFYRQGETEPIKTKTGWLPELVRYKKVVILIDGKTQSSAEVMASTLKKYNVGVVIGETTRGWGTVENTFPIKTQITSDEKHSLFLVHRITLRDDGQPIEGRGVEPMINIKDAKWREKLLEYFNDPNLIYSIETLY